MNSLLQSRWLPVLMLTCSNLFMTVAWYGHLKFKEMSWSQNLGLFSIILISWGLAFFEYLFQVPANRIGSARFSVTQLKVMQECITLVVFTVIAAILFNQWPRWNNVVSFALIVGAVYFTFSFNK